MLDRFAGGADGKAYLATLNPQKRIGKPDEVANAILFVTSGGRQLHHRAHPQRGRGQVGRLNRLVPVPYYRKRLWPIELLNCREKVTRITIAPNPSRVLVTLGSTVLADSRNALTLRELIPLSSTSRGPMSRWQC